MTRSSILVPTLGALFLFCQVGLSSFEGMWGSFMLYFIISYFVMPGFYLLESCSFQVRDRKWVNLERKNCGEELERLKGVETIIKINYKKVCIYNNFYLKVKVKNKKLEIMSIYITKDI